MQRNQGYVYRLQLDQRAIGHSVLSFLAEYFEHSTVEQWTERICDGQVHLNGKPIDLEQPLYPGSSLEWNRPGWVEEDTPQFFERLFVDEYLVAVGKPSGLPTLPGAGFLQNTLLHLVQREFPEARPLHRLGRATSGIVLFARDRATAGSVSRGWPRVEKQYRGLSCHRAAREAFDIRVPIGPVDHPRLGRVFAADIAGKPARSVARVLNRQAETTLFEVDLHTGRPHQIRIHLACIGHPLLGDPMYQIGGGLCANPGLPGDSGYFLHATRLVLEHPVTRQRLDLRCPPPEYLETGVTQPDPIGT